MNGEEWRESMHPKYEVSNLGRIRNRSGQIQHWEIGGNGNAICNIGALDKVVAQAWIGELPKGMVVLHIDGNQRNNKAENLCFGLAEQQRRLSYQAKKYENGELRLKEFKENLRIEKQKELKKQRGTKRNWGNGKKARERGLKRAGF